MNTVLSLAQFARWNAQAFYADSALPASLVYGLPRNWPHIRAVCERAGFRHAGDTEVILIARVADLPEPEPRPGVTAGAGAAHQWVSPDGRGTGPRLSVLGRLMPGD
ncbi:hypothetical protein [Streptomyces sp. NPDC007991]|uniref:hypothetical protein n=1 Tax=Streptomyces sp. NPDC007991 TaxID=3364803 RepID=UPI0036E7F08A